MNISFGLSVAVTLIGLAMYMLTANAKMQETGRIMFAMGLLATLLKFSGQAALHIG
jgi:Na+/phosphate symporter